MHKKPILSARAESALNTMGVSFWELTGFTDQEILKYRNVGKTTLVEFVSKLHEYGLQLNMGEPAEMLTEADKLESRAKELRRRAAKILSFMPNVKAQR